MNDGDGTAGGRVGPEASGAAGDGIELAQAAVAALLRAGVREVVVCAGARNAALVAVVTVTTSLRRWSFPEERCAGFFALGRARATEAPVAVLTTSGTAVAELLPAAIEAWYQSAPLVLVTADRPRAFRGTGAPQAIEQAGLFAPYVSLAADVASTVDLAAFDRDLAGWPGRGPVHLNICLEEPTAAALAQARPAVAEPRRMPAFVRGEAAVVSDFVAAEEAGPLVAVVAALPLAEQPAAARFLQRLGCPVVAEATSGLREHPDLAGQRVFAGEAALARLAVGRVLRLGGVPSSRWWRDLERRPDVRVLSLTPSAFPGLARSSEVQPFPDWDLVVLPPRPGGSSAPSTAGLHHAVAAMIDAHSRSEPSLVHALSSCLPCGSLVFLGNSLPIREWNVFATHHHRSLRCHANRGANGIDGAVSTFLGLAADEPECWAVIGDLTALYDLAALWITPSLPAARRRIAIINNHGGRIFSRLPALRGLPLASQHLMENPHSLAFRGWAKMFGWTYARATTRRAIQAAVRRADPHLILEIVPDPGDTEAAWQMITT